MTSMPLPRGSLCVLGDALRDKDERGALTRTPQAQVVPPEAGALYKGQAEA